MSQCQNCTTEKAQYIWDVLGKLLSEQCGVEIKYTVNEKNSISNQQEIKGVWLNETQQKPISKENIIFIKQKEVAL